VRFGNQLILIVAGRGTGGAALRSAELYDFATDRFGEVASTGALPVPEAAPHAALLGDGTVVVAGAAQTAVYFAPRGDGL